MKTRITLLLSAIALTLFCPVYAQNLFVTGYILSQNDAGFVDEYTQSGEVVRHFVPLDNNGSLSSPYNLRFGPNGNLFVTSTAGNNSKPSAIKEYDGKTGAFLGDVYHTPASGATDLLFDSQGDLYLADPSVKEILKIDPTHRTLLRTYDIGFVRPESLAFLPDGNLVLTDDSGLSLTKLDVTTGDTSPFGMLHHFPRGITVGPDGRYYITEPLGLVGGPGPDNTIEVVGPDGGEAVPWSKGGTVGYYTVFSNGSLFSSGTGPAPGSGVDRVSVFNLATGQFQRSFDTGEAPTGIALGPAVPEPGPIMMLCGIATGTISLLRRKRRA